MTASSTAESGTLGLPRWKIMTAWRYTHVENWKSRIIASVPRIAKTAVAIRGSTWLGRRESPEASGGFTPGEAGDPGLEFFVVVAGDAIATVEGDEVGRIATGGFFGEMALLDGGERVATVTATSTMGLLVLGRHEFNEMLEIAMPSVAPKLLAVVGARMRTIERHAGVESTLGL